MSDDRKLPARHAPSLPSVLKDVTGSNHLRSGEEYWFGPQWYVLEKRKRVVDASTALMRSQAAQGDAYVGLLDARVRTARKFGELGDLANLLAEEQREREHARALGETRRVIETLRAAHDVQLAIAKNNLELARTQEQVVRAQRNLEAARRVADVEIDAWYQAAAAKRNESEATRQDTDHDLHNTQPPASLDALKDAAKQQLAADLAFIEQQIELERERGNAAAVMTLSNLRARLRAA